MKLSPFIVASALGVTISSNSHAVGHAIEKICRDTEILLNLEIPSSKIKRIKSCVVDVQGQPIFYVENRRNLNIPTIIKANRAGIEKELGILKIPGDIGSGKFEGGIWKFTLGKEDALATLGLDKGETLVSPRSPGTRESSSASAPDDISKMMPASTLTKRITPTAVPLPPIWENSKKIDELPTLQGHSEKRGGLIHLNTILGGSGVLGLLGLGVYFGGKYGENSRKEGKKKILGSMNSSVKDIGNQSKLDSKNNGEGSGISQPGICVDIILDEFPVLTDQHLTPEEGKFLIKAGAYDSMEHLGLDIDLDILDKIFQGKVDFLFEGIEPNYALIDFILKDPKNWDCMIPLYRAYNKVKSKLSLDAQSILDKKFIRNLGRDAMKLIDNPETFLSTVSDDLRTEAATLHSADTL